MNGVLDRSWMILDAPAEMARPSQQSSDATPTPEARLKRGILRLIGLAPDGSANSPANGQGDGGAHGTANWFANGDGNGTAKGDANGLRNGLTNGFADGDAHADANGAEDGDANGTAAVSALERALGLEYQVVDGIVEAYAPGQKPTPRPKPEEHAAALLTWLQELFAGNEVPAKLLAKTLYPAMCEARGWVPYPWQKIATPLKGLPGVRCRQLDRRIQPNYDEYSPVLYRIPHARRAGRWPAHRRFT